MAMWIGMARKENDEVNEWCSLLWVVVPTQLKHKHHNLKREESQWILDRSRNKWSIRCQ